MTKSTKHWYARYSGDYRAKTAGLSLVQHGAYTLLLDEYYNTGKPLDANAQVLHRICSALADEEKEAINFILERFFEKTEKGYINKRADEEIEKRSSISFKRQKAANLRHAKSVQSDMQTPCKTDANAHAFACTPTPTPTRGKPPYPLKEKKVGFKNKFLLEEGGGRSYDIDQDLNDTGRTFARMSAPGWDMYELVKIYNDGIAKGDRLPPDKPNLAFPAWCAKYIKGKSYA